MNDIEILQSIIDNKGDCCKDNIWCVGCPLANEIRTCSAPFYLNKQEERKWNKEKLALAKKRIMEVK